MSWASPSYTKGEVDRAGWTFVDKTASATDRELARAVINNWRSSHSFPLNTIQVNLRSKVSTVDPEGLVAQRIKRLPSIQQKLLDRPSMRLSRMQDIGGCRGVVADMPAVWSVLSAFEDGRHAHKLGRHDDYVLNPKTSGYRGHHLVFKYHSDRNSTYNGQSIEVQVRTRLQHAWATAVETVGTFTKQSLKSSRGQQDWLRFFALMSTAMANQEGGPGVPGTPDNPSALRRELEELAIKLDVIRKLHAFSQTLQVLEDDAQSGRLKYVVLELEVEVGGMSSLTVRRYRDLATATSEYGALELAAEQYPNLDVVLVNVGDLNNLRRAYPNYYLDTAVFQQILEDLIHVV